MKVKIIIQHTFLKISPFETLPLVRGGGGGGGGGGAGAPWNPFIDGIGGGAGADVGTVVPIKLQVNCSSLYSIHKIKKLIYE